MSKLERIIHDNSNGLDYILVGEIYLPLIAVPEEKREIDHFDREPKKFETNEICSIMDTQITGWKRAGVHRFSKEGYGRQRSWIREGAEEEGGNEPDKDGFTKLTKAEQLELPFDLPDREKG